MVRTLYLDPPVHDALIKLSATTRVPVAVYMREAIADLLRKHRVRVAKK